MDGLNANDTIKVLAEPGHNGSKPACDHDTPWRNGTDGGPLAEAC